MASAAIRSVMESYIQTKSVVKEDLIIVAGKGLRSKGAPVLMNAVRRTLQLEYGIQGRLDEFNAGRIVVDSATLRRYVAQKSWL